VVIFDGAKGNKQTALDSLKQPMDWFWSAGTLYVNAASESWPGLREIWSRSRSAHERD
jgi:hypothetical protein